MGVWMKTIHIIKIKYEDGIWYSHKHFSSLSALYIWLKVNLRGDMVFVNGDVFQYIIEVEDCYDVDDVEKGL